MAFYVVKYPADVDLSKVSLPDNIFEQSLPYACRIPLGDGSGKFLTVSLCSQPPQAFVRIPTPSLSSFTLNNSKVSLRLLEPMTVTIAHFSPALWPTPPPLFASTSSALSLTQPSSTDGSTVTITFNAFARDPLAVSIGSSAPSQSLSLHHGPPRGLLVVPAHDAIPQRDWVLSFTYDARISPDPRTVGTAANTAVANPSAAAAASQPSRGFSTTYVVHRYAVIHHNSAARGNSAQYTEVAASLAAARAQGTVAALDTAFDAVHQHARSERSREIARARLGKFATEAEIRRADAAAGVVDVPLPRYAPALDGARGQPFEHFHSAFSAPAVPLSRIRLSAAKRGDQTVMKVVRVIPRDAARAELERLGEGTGRRRGGGRKGRGGEGSSGGGEDRGKAATASAAEESGRRSRSGRGRSAGAADSGRGGAGAEGVDVDMKPARGRSRDAAEEDVKPSRRGGSRA